MNQFRRDILDEHADEAAFLFRQRGRAFSSRLHRLSSLADLDERLGAHLDGLAVAGMAGWKTVAAGLAGDDAAEVFTAAVTGLALGDAGVEAEIEAALSAPASAAGLRWALRLAEGVPCAPALRRWLAHVNPLVRAFAADALAFRGEPVPPAVTGALLAEPAPLVLCAALGVVQRDRGCSQAAAVTALLGHDRPEVRRAALPAGLALGVPEAAEAGRAWCADGGETAVTALDWVPLVAADELVPVLQRALGSAHARAACIALGRLGRPEAAECLLEAAAQKPSARAAGLALTLMFGLDLRALKLELPAEARPAPEDDLALDPDEDLPWPDTSKLAAAVRDVVARAPQGQRLRGGVAWSEALLEREINDGCLPDRAAALREAYLRNPQASWREPRAWAAHGKRASAYGINRGEATAPAARSNP